MYVLHVTILSIVVKLSRQKSSVLLGFCETKLNGVGLSWEQHLRLDMFVYTHTHIWREGGHSIRNWLTRL